MSAEKYSATQFSRNGVMLSNQMYITKCRFLLYSCFASAHDELSYCCHATVMSPDLMRGHHMHRRFDRRFSSFNAVVLFKWHVTLDHTGNHSLDCHARRLTHALYKGTLNKGWQRSKNEVKVQIYCARVEGANLTEIDSSEARSSDSNNIPAAVLGRNDSAWCMATDISLTRQWRFNVIYAAHWNIASASNCCSFFHVLGHSTTGTTFLTLKVK